MIFIAKPFAMNAESIVLLKRLSTFFHSTVMSIYYFKFLRTKVSAKHFFIFFNFFCLIFQYKELITLKTRLLFRLRSSRFLNWVVITWSYSLTRNETSSLLSNVLPEFFNVVYSVYGLIKFYLLPRWSKLFFGVFILFASLSPSV